VVIHPLLTAETWVESQGSLYGFCGGHKWHLGKFLSECLGFSPADRHTTNAPYLTSSSSGAGAVPRDPLPPRVE